MHVEPSTHFYERWCHISYFRFLPKTRPNACAIRCLEAEVFRRSSPGLRIPETALEIIPSRTSFATTLRLVSAFRFRKALRAYSGASPIIVIVLSNDKNLFRNKDSFLFRAKSKWEELGVYNINKWIHFYVHAYVMVRTRDRTNVTKPEPPVAGKSTMSLHTEADVFVNNLFQRKCSTYIA
jgi:hypothetical protein